MFQGSTLKAKAGWLLLGLLLIGMSMLVVWSAPWRVATAQAQKVTFIYSVKYVCTDLPAFAEPRDPMVIAKPGIYRTVINIHNFLDQEVKLTKKVVAARGQDSPRGPISERVADTLKPDEAIDIICPDIAKLFKGQVARAATGFVVIESPVELEVVAVYTNLIYVQDVNIEDWKNWVFVLKVTPGAPIPPPTQLPLPIGTLGDIALEAPPLGTLIDPAAEVRKAINDYLQKQGKSPLPPQVTVQIIDFDYGLGKGVGVGAGISIDVEYIQPKRVER